MSWLTTAPIIPLLLVACWLYTASVANSRFPKLTNKRICLLIAHPDDEAMFFAPSILALTDPTLGNHVKILCLSSGDADGLGETRKKELVKSGMLLGLRKEDDVFVLDSPDFPDSMTTTWSEDKIAQLLSSAFAPALAQKKSNSSSSPPPVTIDILLTFDNSGISSHPNHISLYHGARRFQSLLTAGLSGWRNPVDVYTLTTVNIARKYIGAVDAVTTMASAAWSAFSSKSSTSKEHPQTLVFVSPPQQVRVAQKAMTHGHISQMRWFRWGWIGLSRYMYVNDLHLEKVAS